MRVRSKLTERHAIDIGWHVVAERRHAAQIDCKSLENPMLALPR
jgi:hypothetical protein